MSPCGNRGLQRGTHVLQNETPDQRGSHLLEAETSLFFPHACSSPFPDSLPSSVRVLPVESAGVCVARSDVGRSLLRCSASRLSHLVAVSVLPPAEHDSRRSCCLDISCYLIKMTDDNESHWRRSSIDLHTPPASHA